MPRKPAAAQTRRDNDKKTAEAVENVLRLSQVDRQRIQLALTSLGFDTRGSDGVLGPRSRDMIAGWQKARSQVPTGYLTAAQNQALLREAATALARHDDDQKKADEGRKKAEEARIDRGCRTVHRRDGQLGRGQPVRRDL